MKKVCKVFSGTNNEGLPGKWNIKGKKGQLQLTMQLLRGKTTGLWNRTTAKQENNSKATEQQQSKRTTIDVMNKLWSFHFENIKRLNFKIHSSNKTFHNNSLIFEKYFFIIHGRISFKFRTDILRNIIYKWLEYDCIFLRF